MTVTATMPRFGFGNAAPWAHLTTVYIMGWDGPKQHLGMLGPGPTSGPRAHPKSTTTMYISGRDDSKQHWGMLGPRPTYRPMSAWGLDR